MSTIAEQFWDEITRDDLPGDLAEIAEAVGMGVIRYLVEEWGGTQLYVHSRNTVEKSWRDRKIRERWNGRNAGTLAKEYGVNRRYIYETLKGDRKAPSDPSQGDLF